MRSSCWFTDAAAGWPPPSRSRRRARPARGRAACADASRDLGHERLRRRQADAHAVADRGHGDDLDAEVVLGRAGARAARRLERDLPRVDADRDRAVARLGAEHLAAAVERDDASGRRPPARAVPVSTTAPVKSATNAEAGAAASSAAVPCCTIRPPSITPTRSPSSAASVKSWVTSSAGTPASRSTAASSRAARRARARVERRQRLVEQQRGRARAPARARARRAGARRPTACRGRASAQRGDAEALEQLERARRGARARRMPAQPVGDVLPRAAGARTARSPGTRSRSARRSGGTSTPRAVSSQTSLAARHPARVRPHAARRRRAARVVLPAPDGPGEREARAGGHLERDVERERPERACAPQRAAPPGLPIRTSLTDSRSAAETATSTADSASAPVKSVAKRS